VIRVSDGDTITVLVDKEQIRVRLEGIDCPESGQPFGNRATQLTQKLCAGKTVRIEKTGEDRYGRTLGIFGQ
jgi:micrococcal nuclease